MTTELIKTKIDSVLELYELDQNWVKIKSKKKNKILSYQVKIPTDLPIPILLADIKEIVQVYSTEIKVFELSQISGVTNIEFKNKNEILFNLKFEYDKNIKRNRISFGFVLYDISDISQNELNKIIILPHHFLGLLIPSENNILVKDTLIDHQKSYAILFNHNINDEKYVIKNSFTKLRVKISLINIFNDFNNTSGLFIENNFYSEINKHKPYIETEFTKSNYKIEYLNNFIDLREKEINEQKSLLKYYMETNPNKTNIVFLANSIDFLNLVKEIEKYKKKGNKLLEF